MDASARLRYSAEFPDRACLHPMTVLVTGAAGFIGAFVAHALARRGERVVGLDNFNAYYAPALKRARAAALGAGSDFPLVEADIADRAAIEALWREHRPRRVVHLAAQAGVRWSLENPRAYVQANVVGFLEILEACRIGQVEHLVYASTSSLYGRSPEQPFRESASIRRPVSLYAATKGANELMAASYAHLYHFPATALRFFTVYGPWGRPDMAPLLFTRAILEGRPIRVYNHGRMKRDFTYIDDIVAGVIAALDRPPARDDYAAHAVYNLGRGEPVDLERFIALIEQAAGRPAIREYMDMQAGDMSETFADVTAAATDLGYAPQVSIDAGVPQVVEWCRRYQAQGGTW